MKKGQKNKINPEAEMEMLSEMLSSEEMYVLEYLKGFNRSNMKEWQERGLGIFSVEGTGYRN
jgi:hypothetical protein